MPPRKSRRGREGTTPVADALRDLAADHVECRDLAHAWRVDGYTSGSGNVHRLLVCDRCGTERRDVWMLARARVGTRYAYAYGYALRDVDFPTDRLALLREDLRRAGLGPDARARRRVTTRKRN